VEEKCEKTGSKSSYKKTIMNERPIVRVKGMYKQLLICNAAKHKASEDEGEDVLARKVACKSKDEEARYRGRRTAKPLLMGACRWGRTDHLTPPVPFPLTQASEAESTKDQQEDGLVCLC
jgi:hypothetical protein